jgi:ABC-type iron transport system FetAB permease component
MLIILIILLLTLPIVAFYMYDRRMMALVARSSLVCLLRLWLMTLLTWGLLWVAGTLKTVELQSAQAPHTIVVAIGFVLIAVWAVATCTRRAMKVFRSSMAEGQAQREYLLANGATRREAVRPFMRRAMRRTIIASLRIPLIPAMLLLVASGTSPLQAAIFATLMQGCIQTASMTYVLLLTQEKKSTKNI